MKAALAPLEKEACIQKSMHMLLGPFRSTFHFEATLNIVHNITLTNDIFVRAKAV